MSIQGNAMTGSAFKMLVGAYGADTDRWPEKVRISALPFADTAEGKEILASASKLDAALKRYEIPPASSALSGKILASGYRQMGSRLWLRRLALGAVMGGLSVAGGLAGAAAMIMISPQISVLANEPATAFGDIVADQTPEAQ